MNVRRAKYDDIADILNLMEAYHKDSNMSEIPFVRKDAVRVIDYHISHRDCLPLVAYNDAGELVGLLFGEVVPFFFNSKEYYITDLMFISHGAGMQLLNKLKHWMRTISANRIMMAVSSGDPRADAFLEVSGLEKTGNMYVIHR